MDDAHTPTSLRIKLKKSKTDQLGNGVDVYVGRINSPLCPVGAGLDYMAVRGPIWAHSLGLQMVPHSRNLSLHNMYVMYCKQLASRTLSLLDTALGLGQPQLLQQQELRTQ